MSVPGPFTDHNGISIRIGVPRHVVCVRKPRRVYTVSCCAYAAAHKAIIASIALAKLQPDAIFLFRRQTNHSPELCRLVGRLKDKTS